VAETLLLVETDAKLLSPVDTGYNRASIHAERASNGLSGRVVAEAAYAIHLEEGTKYMRAQPFLGPALQKNRQAFVNAIRKAGLSIK